MQSYNIITSNLDYNIHKQYITIPTYIIFVGLQRANIIKVE